MGYMRHHAILVTSWDAKLLASAHAQAVKMFAYVSPISPAFVNGYQSFFIPPDGSKEGWPESDAGARSSLVTKMERTLSFTTAKSGCAPPPPP